MFEYNARDEGKPDELFLERLDTFMDKCMADMRAFSERELRPFEETRQYIAEWHSKYLFQPRNTPSSPGPSGIGDRTTQVRSVLYNASRILESLFEASGIQSFLLAVDPGDPTDGGFLGGSVVGREFWRGLRGGGEAGAKGFKLHCQKVQPPASGEDSRGQPSVAPQKQSLAKSLKNELYEGVRTALRSASGVRNAEMKWTNPERLDVYGVRLVGWPLSIPSQNPSSLKLNQNRQLLELLEDGTMRFEKTLLTGSTGQEFGEPESAEMDEDFSWAYDADGGAPSTHTKETITLPSTDIHWDDQPQPSRKRPRNEEGLS